MSASSPSAEIEKAPQSSKVISAADPLGSIHELWNEAYDELRSQEEKLIKDYEASLHGDPAMMLGSTVILSGFKLERKTQMAALLARKVEEVKKNTWRLKFGGHDVPLKDLAEPVLGIVQWADDYISGALSANPYASIAWGGVSLLLPLVLNPSKQAASLATGLAYISDLIVRSKMREDLYGRRYGSKGCNEDQEKFISSHMIYRDSLKTLYVQILKFQASSICYMSKNGAFRLGLDMIKWDDWDSSLNDVQKREDAFQQVYAIWKDIRDQEDCDTLFTQHQEKMSVITSISVDVSSLRDAIEKAQMDTNRTNLLNWLSTIDPSKFYSLGLDEIRADTGDWLLDGNPDFKNWQTSPNSFAWLNGKAGSGKSVLSSSIIKHLKERSQSNPDTALAFFYFSFTDDKTQSVIEMLCSLIKQICCCRPNTPKSVKSLIDYKEKGHRPDRRTLEHILVDTIHGFSRFYVVLDALDECPSENGEREKLLESLSRIRSGGSQYLHLLCTSRRVADIEAVLEPIASSDSNVDIDLSAHRKAVDHDIGLHVDKTFDTVPFKSWPDSIKAEAKAALIERADGMFQYVACQFDSLRGHRATAKIREALRNLPKGLDATYDRMLQGIDPQYQKQVANVLKWLAFSIRPLYLEELAEIFILDHEKDVPFDENDRLFTAEEVLNYLPGLITKVSFKMYDYGDFRYTENATEIRFAHFSIKEYLSSARVAQEYLITPEQTAHLHIAESCLAYHLQLSQSILATKDALRQYALWDYVARYCVAHLEKVDLKSWGKSVTSRAERVFAHQTKNMLSIVRIRDPDSRRNFNNWTKTVDTLYSPLYYAVSMEAFQLILLLIHNGAEINELSPARKHGTALQAAVREGNQEIVQLLLDKGADINMQGGTYGTALQAALAKENQQIVQLLLDKGADVNVQGGTYGTPLQVAVAKENQKIVQLLLDKGADINLQGGAYGTPLQAAVAKENQQIAQLLLDKGADVNVQGGAYGTALQAALAKENHQMVQLLLDKGADVNAQGRHYGNALQATVLEGNQEIVQLLLDNGANVNAQGGHYGNALQAAVARGNQEIVQLLLDKGADVNAQGGYYENALQAAVTKGNQKIIQLLLDKGADVNAQGGYYKNALQAAVREGNQKIIQLLLDNGANVNIQGEYFGTALQAAAYWGRMSNLQLLLEKGADIHAKGGVYGNALHAAIGEDELQTAELLLAQGAKLNPSRGEWEELLARVEEEEGRNEADRLRAYRENPSGYIDRRRQEPGASDDSFWADSLKVEIDVD